MAVTVVVDRANADLDTVLRALVDAGLSDALAHRRLGIISGTVAQDQLESLREVPGVTSLREERQYRAL